MRTLMLLAVLGFASAVCAAEAPSFKKVTLTDQFYCEGAYYGDFNKDGKLDVVSGPFWYEGPSFEKKHTIHEPKAYDPKGYSENFLTYTGDFNADGWTDVFYVPWPGKDAFWYENPAGKDQPWKQHLALKDVGNESPVWADVTGDGQPELVYNTTGFMGYATYDAKKPEAMWTFHAVTPKGNYQRYTHGVGCGDVNGDGRADIVESIGWWEQPAKIEEGKPWAFYPAKLADSGAQMLVYDVDGDGLNDVITAWHCHQYGLVWQKQVRDEQGKIAWKQNDILSSKPDVKSDALRISQLHAFELVDMNNDGIKDFLTGKRFWAHGPKGDVEPDAPAVVYWFELRRDAQKGVQFVPHKIDDDSGVGTQVASANLNGDAIPDVIVGNKKGSFIFLSQPGK